MRRIRMLLVAVLMAFPVVAVTAGHALACPDHACGGMCTVNPPVRVGDDVIYFNEGPIVYCRRP